MSFDHSFQWVNAGRVAFGELPGRWRDVQQDLDWLRKTGIQAILSLIETEAWLEEYREAGFKTYHIPIDDYHAPTIEQIHKSIEIISKDQPIYIHCHAGLGRAGTIAAAWLIHSGTPPIDAIRIVRQLRPGAVEVDDQFDALLEYAATAAKTPGTAK
jgi:atypical dual specificity phosphatase